MQLLVGRRPVRLPQGQCVPDDVKRAVQRINCPFVVFVAPPVSAGRPAAAAMGDGGGGRFSVRRKVFLTAEDVRVECENEWELGLACRMVAEDHNRWQQADDEDGSNHRCMQETEELEERAALAAESDEGHSGDEAQSDEDISIQEWGQLGYAWFRRVDVANI